MEAILESIMQILNRYGLTDNERISRDFHGILSYALALHHPELFSKIARMSCYPEEKLLDHIVKDKKKLERLCFFVSHESTML